jgi:hypothetical protein
VLGRFEFIFGMVICYDILFVVNTVNKKLQSVSMCIDSTIQPIEGMRTYFQAYRNEGFVADLKSAKDIASELGVEQSFRVKHHASRTKQFDETECEEAIFQAGEDFKVNYFVVTVDMATAYLKCGFEEL